MYLLWYLILQAWRWPHGIETCSFDNCCIILTFHHCVVYDRQYIINCYTGTTGWKTLNLFSKYSSLCSSNLRCLNQELRPGMASPRCQHCTLSSPTRFEHESSPKKVKHINPCSDYGLFQSLAWGKPQSISFQTVTYSLRLKIDYSQLHITSPKHSLRVTLPAARFMYRTPSSLWILPSLRCRLFFCWSWVSKDSAVV